MGQRDKRIDFVVTLANGETVNVSYYPDFIHHLEFRGSISPTGYRSEFPFVSHHGTPSLDEVKERAQTMAQKLYDENPAKHGSMHRLF